MKKKVCPICGKPLTAKGSKAYDLRYGFKECHFECFFKEKKKDTITKLEKEI